MAEEGSSERTEEPTARRLQKAREDGQVARSVELPTAVMLVTATIGGYWGAAMARKLPAVWLRRFIIAVGSLLTVYYFGKTL